jgi:hypothetical protein
MPDDRGGKIAVITIVDVYGSFPMHELDNTQKEKIANSMLNAENANPTYYSEWWKWVRHAIRVLPHLYDQ